MELCIRYALAGFTNSINGAWTFTEVQEGDFVSFLYGATVYNLYTVKTKEALRNAEKLPPWDSITFRQSGVTYYFPFRLHLAPLRQFSESLVRPEFAYVAENLLLRGGYRKTHFQADQTTLQAVSQMGRVWEGGIEELRLPHSETFTPHFTWRREKESIPEIFPFHELILQALVKQYLSAEDKLAGFLTQLGINDVTPESLEVLSEKAFPEGHVDILLKEAVPLGISRKIIIEVKRGAATKHDLWQLRHYVDEIGKECLTGILVAGRFSLARIKDANELGIKPVTYTLDSTGDVFEFEDLLQNFSLKVQT